MGTEENKIEERECSITFNMIQNKIIPVELMKRVQDALYELQDYGKEQTMSFNKFTTGDVAWGVTNKD